MKEIKINVDNYNENSIKTIEGDNLSEVYKIYICKNKRRVNLTNKIAVMAYVDEYSSKRSNILNLNITNAAEGEIELPITNVISRENGVYACEIAIYGENNFLEQTAPFSLIVENNIFSKISNTAINSSDFHILSEAIKTVNEYSDKLREGTENIELRYANKLNDVSTQLLKNAKINYEISKQNSVPYSYSGPVITWVDDDARNGFLTNLKPLLDARNLKCSVAVITSNVGENDYLTKKDLLSLQDQGFEIVSHSSTHDANIYKNNVVTVSENLIDFDMKSSQEWLIDNGFNGFDKLVFPWGNFGSSSKKYKKIARKYFKYALNAIGSYNKTPVDNMYLDRYFINKTMNLETIKAKIDEAISNDGWLILGSHSYSDGEFDKTLFSNVLDYIISKNVPILRLDEAIRYKGNVISVGEYEENENKFLLSVDGKTNFPIIVKTDTNTYNENSLITDFAKDTTTKFISLNSNSFRVAGIMDVFRSSSLYYSYATFTPFNSNRLYMRKWNDTSNKWDAWEEIGSTITTSYATISTSLNGYTVSTTLENRIGKLDKIINGCVTIENENRNGNLKFNDVIALFDKSFSPKNAMFVKLIIVTDTGEFKEAYASVEATNTNTIIKSQFTLEDNNIKYIVCNFNYCLN